MPAPVNFGRGHHFAAYPRCWADSGVCIHGGLRPSVAVLVSLVGLHFDADRHVLPSLEASEDSRSMRPLHPYQQLSWPYPFEFRGVPAFLLQYGPLTETERSNEHALVPDVN